MVDASILFAFESEFEPVCGTGFSIANTNSSSWSAFILLIPVLRNVRLYKELIRVCPVMCMTRIQHEGSETVTPSRHIHDRGVEAFVRVHVDSQARMCYIVIENQVLPSSDPRFSYWTLHTIYRHNHWDCPSSGSSAVQLSKVDFAT